MDDPKTETKTETRTETSTVATAPPAGAADAGAVASPYAVGAPHAVADAPRRGTTFETLAVCGFIFGIFSIVVATFAVGLAARAVSEADGSGSPAAGGGASSAEVALKDFTITPKEIKVSSGAVLHITNEGAVPHDLAVEGLASDMLDPGASGDLKLVGLAPGTYTMTCQVPGHEDAGMTGTIVVT